MVVTRIDRLARSLRDLQTIVHELKGRGVALKAIEQPIDTGTAAGKAFLNMLGMFAEFEANLRRKRRKALPLLERGMSIRADVYDQRGRDQAIAPGRKIRNRSYRPEARHLPIIGVPGRAVPERRHKEI